jgi:hypothetical protein
LGTFNKINPTHIFLFSIVHQRDDGRRFARVGYAQKGFWRRFVFILTFVQVVGGGREGVCQGRGSAVVSCGVSVGSGRGSRRVSGRPIFNPIDCIQVSASEEARNVRELDFGFTNTCADHMIY